MLTKAIIVNLMILFFLTPYYAETKTLSSSTPANYALALQATNSFLSAWASRDSEAGARLISHRLSSELQKRKDKDWFENYMVGVSNPHHLSFEIGTGKMINANRLSFPVILYEHYTGERGAFRYKSKIEIFRDGGSWMVDILPVTPNSEKLNVKPSQR